MKRKINWLIPIFILLLLIYGVRTFLGPRVRVETLKRSSVEDVINTTGVVIKYETVLGSETVGVYEPIAQEGDRVAVGQEVAVVYTGKVDAEEKSKLEQLNKKISQVEKNQTELNLFTGDVTRLEQSITEETKKLIETSRIGNMAHAGAVQLKIKALCAKKAQISGATSVDNTLTELYKQKEQLESQIGSAQKKIKATMAGLFSVAVDGLETVITPYNMMELTPNGLTELLEHSKQKQEQTNQGSCKVIKNFRYFIALNLPEDKVASIEIDDPARARFYDLSQDEINVKILYKSAPQDGQCTLILEGDRHLDSLLKCRSVNLEFIKNSHNGFRVSLECLRSKNEEAGVYVRRDNMLKFIPVNIIYNTEDYAIIESADSEMPLKLYDEVVVSASSYEEGKLLR